MSGSQPITSTIDEILVTLAVELDLIDAKHKSLSEENERLRTALKAHEVQWNRLQDAIAGMEKTMEAHGIDHFKWQPMTFEETLKGDAP